MADASNADHDGAVPSDRRGRDQVIRLLTYLRELVRSRSQIVTDIGQHSAVLWLGKGADGSAPIPIRASAAPGQVLVELAHDAPAHQMLSDVVDEWHENSENLELVLANALVTVQDVEGSDVPVAREFLLTQSVVADREPATGIIRVSIGAGAAPMVHDTGFLAPVEGIELGDAVKVRAKMTELPSLIGSKVADLVDDWVRVVEVDPREVTMSVDMRPALVLRNRSVTSSLAFYDAMITQLRDPTFRVPIGLAQLVEPIEADDRVAALIDSDASSPVDLVRDAIYPLPSNVEQRDVLTQLGVDSGVVVEGPPGTGKTHTITNLTAALLAKGQRVLVVSEKAQALRVVRDMLPEPIRELAVSIADVTRDDFDEVVSGVEAIAVRKSAFQPRIADAEIADLTAKREQALIKRQRVLHELWTLRESETVVHEWVAGEYKGTAAEIVRQVNAREAQYSWLPGPLDGAFPPLDVPEFIRLLDLLRSTGGSTARLGQRLPDLFHHLPDSVDLERILARIDARPREKMAGSGSLLSILQGVDSQRLVRIRDICERLAVASSEVMTFPPPIVDMANRLLAGQAGHLWSRVTMLSPAIAEAAARDRALGAHSVVVDGVTPGAGALFDAAADYLESGGRWRGRVRRSEEQRAVEESGVRATVDGRVPTDAVSLRLVADHLSVFDAIHTVQRVLADLHVPVDTSGSRSTQLNQLVRLDDQLAWMSDLLVGRDHLIRELEAISPGGPRPRSVAEVADVAVQAGAIAATNDAVLAEQELAEGAYALSAEVDKGPSPEGDALVSALANADADAIRSARQNWGLARTELEEQTAADLLTLRLRAKAPEFARVLALTAADSAWNERLRNVREAWDWRRARSWAEQRSDPTSEARLQSSLDEVDADIAQLTTSLVAALAWRNSLSRMSIGQVQALQSFRDHMINLGKGSGKHANRFRAAARDAMEQAQTAVPVWVMSISQVVETLPPVHNCFDVVIVDEASQADITSSLLLWLAPRVIVVGDDKQCAPVGLGGITLDDAFARLDSHLPDLPHYLRDSLTPRSSLFSLLRSRFGHLIRLREHFRSVPEIIEFSSQQFYSGAPLIPVRQYGADRLPPLRVVKVPEGAAVGNGAGLVNETEAQAITNAVVDCMRDPAYDGLDFGVIVMQGTKQVDEISERLRAAMTDEQWRARRVRVGTPPDFQGDERNVVFLSMVVSDPEAIAPLTRAESQRRVNVAASRAMDQMWLFHSIPLNSLRANDLRASLLGYMLANQGALTEPMPTDVPDNERREPFETLFEQRVFNRLASRGYHVTPKVMVNNRTIDLVVTGDDARMAVECDGDEFHTTGEQARSVMEREQELRRCGWEFWRVRESEYELDPERALAGLWDALDRRGVKPSSSTATNANNVSRRTVTWAPIDLSAGD